MSWTKRQLVDAAFEEAGYASYAGYDIDPGLLEAGLRRLDAMMALWNSSGIRVGYPLPDSPSASNLDDDSGLPDRAIEAVYANLAMRIGPPIGKTLPAETRMAARAGYAELLKRAAMPQEQQFPDTLPAGAGNKPWRYNDPFVEMPSDSLTVGPDGPLDDLTT